MRKTIVIAALAMICSFTGFSQLKLGVSTSISSSFTSSNQTMLPGSDRLIAYDFQFVSQESVHSFGLVAYRDFGRLFFMPQVQYRKSTYNYSMMDYAVTNAEFTPVQDVHHYIHIPVIAGVQLDKFRIGTGPIFNFLVDGEMQLAKYEGFEVSERNLKTGFQFVLGYDPIKQIKFNLKYETYFNGVSDDYYYLEKPTFLKNRSQLVTFGIGVFI